MFVAVRKPTLKIVRAIGKGGMVEGNGSVVSVKLMADTLKIDQMRETCAGDTGYLCDLEVGVSNVRKKDIKEVSDAQQ